MQKCKKCGALCSDELSQCPNCGYRSSQYHLAGTTDPSVVPKGEYQLQRNKLVTLWVWISIVYCIASIAACTVELVSEKGWWTRYPDKDAFNYVSICFNIVAVISYALLLRWKKYGFISLVFSGIIILMAGIMTHKVNHSAIDLVTTFIPIISIFVLSLLFFLKKGGKSAWRNLLSAK